VLTSAKCYAILHVKEEKKRISTEENRTENRKREKSKRILRKGLKKRQKSHGED